MVMDWTSPYLGGCLMLTEFEKGGGGGKNGKSSDVVYRQSPKDKHCYRSHRLRKENSNFSHK
jgi:hypothetical protein